MAFTRRRLSVRRMASRVGKTTSKGFRMASRSVGMVATAARDTVASFIDNCVYAVAPEAGIRRKAMRSILKASEARMAASDRDDDQGNRLHGSQRYLNRHTSPNTELELTLQDLQQRSLEMCRDTTAGGVVDSRVDHVIGKGFTVQAKIKAVPGVSDEAAKGWNDQLESVYKRWSPKCDLTGRDSLWQLSRLVERSICTFGESFTVMWMKQRPNQPIPLVLEVVDPQRISTPPSKASDPYCRLGIQYAPDGEILGYWLQSTHPYDSKQLKFQWDFIPSERMLHVFEKWFPEQSRGYPWMTRTLDRWRDGEDLDEAGIIAAQVEACNAAFVKTKNPYKMAKGMATGQANGVRLEDTVPGKIHYLDASCEEVVFNTPTKSNIVGTLHEWNHRRIAAGMNWPYEFLMKDWSGVTFAGGRLILSGAKITCQSEQQLLTVSWFACIWNELVRLSVLFSHMSGVEINLSKFQQRPWVYQAHQWSAPTWSYAITPLEEIQADVMAVDNNFKTAEQVTGERGGNLEDVYDQREIEVALESKKNIVPSDRVAALAQQGKQAKQAANDSPQAKEMKNAA